MSVYIVSLDSANTFLILRHTARAGHKGAYLKAWLNYETLSQNIVSCVDKLAGSQGNVFAAQVAKQGNTVSET